MPQTVFYFNDQDIEDLFNFIQLKGGKFVPDIFFASSEYITIDNVNSFNHYRAKETTHFFITDETYTSKALVISRNRYIEEPKYMINQRKGGPYIDLSFYRGYSDDSTILYKKSYIELYSKFIHSHGDEEFEASNEVKDYYKDLVKYIKSKCKVITKNDKKHLVSTKVITELNI